MTQKTKPKKPYKTFPLYAHNRGYWAKKINGKLYYFGKWDDPDGANEEYERVRHDLENGKEPAERDDSLCLMDACNLFMDAKKREVESGEIKQLTWNEYQRCLKDVMKCMGQTVSVANLSPQDFQRLRESLAVGVAAVTLKNKIAHARVFFNWLYNAGHVAKPLQYKTTLKPPSKSVLRRARAEKPAKLFTQKELAKLLKHATGFMGAAIMLGINAGLGNRDVCELQWTMIDAKGWLTFPRPKTGIARRAKLWKETIKALEEWRKVSPESEYVCCGQSGQHLGESGGNTPIAHLFDDIVESASVTKDGRGFYAIRHTYRTIADETRDVVAVRVTMGHGDHGIDDHYREQVEDSRLETISAHVQRWMFPAKKKSKS